MKRLRLSPAMVVATVALFAALSGAAVAGTTVLIDGSQIKNHTIGVAKLTPLAVAQLRGHAGPAGRAGPQGPAGPAGGFDPNKVTYIQGPLTTVPPYSAVPQAVTLKATCPAGTKVIAGGAYTNLAIVGASLASPDGTSWGVIVINAEAFQLDNLFAFAVCAAK
jgi:hypothetical protein